MSGGGPRPSARRASTPSRVRRPGPPVAVVTAPAPAASPASAVSIPSSRDRAEPLGTPLSRLPLPPNVPSTTTAHWNALGAADAADEIQFRDSAARYSHADWAREEQAEPACHAATRYIVLGRPPALPTDVLSCFPSH